MVKHLITHRRPPLALIKLTILDVELTSHIYHLSAYVFQQSMHTVQNVNFNVVMLIIRNETLYAACPKLQSPLLLRKLSDAVL